MNDRIKRLLAQAHGEAENLKDTNWIANRFAELIVKECVKVVDDTMTENQEINIGLVMASAAIISHFEIEE